MTKIGAFIRQNWQLAFVFFGALLFASWFAFQAISDALYFNDPRNVDVDLKPWMTPRYVVLTYDLPRSLVAEVLTLDQESDRRIRLGQLAKERGLTMDELTALLRAAAADYRENLE